MALPRLDDLLAEGVRGQRVFVRADLNVPIRGGRVGDDTRIRASLPTLRRLLGAGARVVVTSHLGRPKGKVNPEFSLRPVAPRLAGLLGTGVSFREECIGPDVADAVEEIGPGQVLLLENLRFHPGEEKNDPDFAAALSDWADAYVNDAFGTAHRAHASTVGVPGLVKRRAAGDLMASELEHLEAVRDPGRPLLVILGGAKVSDKLAVLEALAPHADTLAIGGAMAYTFLMSRGEPHGDSLVEPERVDDARRVTQAAWDAGRRLLLPLDHVVADRIGDDAATQVVREIPDGWKAVDIGPETAELYAQEARNARTVFWNGPMGVFEVDRFARGTETVARGVAECAGTTVVGGGDSLAAIHAAGVGERITHLSTGGGASLEYVQGLTLPGVAALES